MWFYKRFWVECLWKFQHCAIGEIVTPHPFMLTQCFLFKQLSLLSVTSPLCVQKTCDRSKQRIPLSCLPDKPSHPELNFQSRLYLCPQLKLISQFEMTKALHVCFLCGSPHPLFWLEKPLSTLCLFPFNRSSTWQKHSRAFFTFLVQFPSSWSFFSYSFVSLISYLSHTWKSVMHVSV